MSIKITGTGGHAKVVANMIKNSSPVKDDWQFIAIGNNKIRKKRAEAFAKGTKFAIVSHEAVTAAGNTQVGEGSVIMPGVVIQPSVIIGKHVILNTSCSVDHDCIIGDYAHIGPGVHLCGGVKVGEGALMGVGSCAVPNAVIKSWSLVKAGTVAK